MMGAINVNSQNLWLAEDVILRKEYFGGIIFKINTVRYYEVNDMGYEILSYIYIHHNILEFPFLEQGKKMIIDFISSSIDNGIIIKYAPSHPSRIINKEKDNVISGPCEAYLYLTNKCNQKCSFCYFQNYHSTNIFSRDDWFSVVDELIDNGLCTLGFLGGEPLLEWETCLELLDYSDGRVHQAITTNGTADNGITKIKAKRLAKYKSFEINISLESYAEDVHNSLVGVKVHSIAMESVKNLIEAGVDVIVKTVALSQNADEIVRLAEWSKKIGANGFYLADYMPYFGQSFLDFSQKIVKMNKYLKIIEQLDKLKSNSFFVLYNTRYRYLHEENKISSKDVLLKNTTFCSASGINIDILPNGDSYTCPMAVGNEDYCIGNAKYGIEVLWNNVNLDFFRKRDVYKLKDEKCISCKSKSNCVGGCPIVATIFGGDSYVGDPRCTKKSFLL